ncbi:hypothetical protein acsn021_03970 [Anaerocolumna cellulosilytica]|uniref:Uncharacterized protein n=1 Tax=Anaerocolumna cellulosilytica TaxID=433286 RepID=A0A6S6R1G6_9FIRM|nr:hypothetical protein [Anaerocolumna cellulosilytica]MBB5197385.1 hypothetical protein [Anaerocolumna cellulosilytica]BCJ92828.1 hypothetical protein acsn021_03970 [Anaerocolumna cellulosilytica]
MRYRIEYADGRRCSVAISRNDLLNQLRTSSSKISDIRKLYKSGVSDSVMATYKQYIKL